MKIVTWITGDYQVGQQVKKLEVSFYNLCASIQFPAKYV